MKKIPTLFKREFKETQLLHLYKELSSPELNPVLEGLAVATVKKDGSCCKVEDGVLYKRYDAKHGKTPPEGAIPCCPPDPVTGHWPHWVKCSRKNPADQFFFEAFDKAAFTDGTYELIGPKVQSNPYNMTEHVLYKHASDTIESLNRAYKDENDLFQSIRQWMEQNKEEGIVFWYKEEPLCKIKQSDFKLQWKEHKMT